MTSTQAPPSQTDGPPLGRSVVTAGAALAVLTLTACGEATTGELIAVRDSAGVAITESFGPRWTPETAWSVHSVPLLALEGTGPAFEFARVTDATHLSDGRYVVLDEGVHQVRFFDERGAFLTATGREGEGPGDFDGLTSVSAFQGDSVMVFDAWLKRVTILDGAGELGRIVSLSPTLEVQELYAISPTEFIAKAWSLSEFMETDGPYRARYQIVRVGDDGAPRDTLADVPGWNGYKFNRGEGRYTDFAPLFPIDTRVVVTLDGITVGTGETMQYARYSLTGALQRLVRVPSLDEQLSAEEIAAERNAMLSPRTRADYREIIRGLPAPAVRPAYSAVLVDELGHTWLARYWSPRRGADDPVEWLIFDPAGAWLGRLVTPPKFTVFEVGSDYILGARRDDFDVQHIEKLAITRSGS